ACTTPSNLGASPETFRRQPATRRSLHPSHSFGAIGPLAEALVAGHHTAGSNFGRGTPMGNLLDRPSYLLGLGSDIGHVTFTHVVEDIEPDFPLIVYAETPFEVDCVDATGATHRLLLRGQEPGEMQRRRIDHPDNKFLRDFFARWFEAHAGLTWHRVGQARCWLVPADAMYREFASLMRQGITIYARADEIAAFEGARAETVA
ncbi:MAG: AAC(3) family N-acetyltransferase, partial [Acetobacteraceae bacterium]